MKAARKWCPRAEVMKLLQVLLLLLLRAVGTEGAPMGHEGGLLYPFGPEVGDEAVPAEDDGSSPEVPLWVPFSFYGRPQSSLYVNANGALSFGRAVPEFTPRPFPLAQPIPIVAPYWADVDVRLGGEVLYRQSREPQLLARLARDLAPALAPHEPPPRPTWAFVATWHRVAYFGSASEKANTFQAVLGTDGSSSYVMLNYGSLQWTTGIANGGDPRSGLGGLPAQAGFTSGDLLHYYNLPGSRQPQVLQVGHRSNVGILGRWIFRVDLFTATPEPPGPAPSPAHTPSPAPGTTTPEEVYLCQ